MSEVMNNEVIEETTECTAVAEEMTGKEKFIAGFKKHGKKIAIGIGTIALGLIGYGLIKKAKSSGCGCDLDDLDAIDVDYVESETIE